MSLIFRDHQFLFVSLLLVATLSGIEATGSGFTVNPQTRFLQDDQGRSRFFHGVNAVMKGAPYHPSIEKFDPQTSMVDEDITLLKKYGINLVRLGVMWPGVEPTQGNYNSTYLDIMKTIVDNLYKQDIYTMVDLHQDSFSRKFCGDGFPPWLVDQITLDHSCDNTLLAKIGSAFGYCSPFDSFKIPNDPEGLPVIGECDKHPFQSYYKTPEVASAFEALYTDEGIIEQMEGYWNTVATAFKDSPGVLGYDLLNEPFAGNYWQKNLELIPGFTDEYLLQPLYQRIHETIRAVDSEKILFFEPVIAPDEVPFLGGKVFSVGFTQGPGGEGFNDRQMLNYHVYCCSAGDDVCAGKAGPDAKFNQLCDKFDNEIVATRQADATKLGVGSIITEFGACPGTAQGCLDEIDRVTNAADNEFISWMYWQYKGFNDYISSSGSDEEGFFDGEGKLQTAKVAALSKPYTTAVQGVPTRRRWDLDTKAFGLEYDLHGAVHNYTYVYTNQKELYPEGYDYSLWISTANSTLSYYDSENYMYIAYNGFDTDPFAVALTVTPYAKPSGDIKVGPYDLSWTSDKKAVTHHGFVEAHLNMTEAENSLLELVFYDTDGKQVCGLSVDQSTTTDSCLMRATDLVGYEMELKSAGKSQGKFNIGPMNETKLEIKISVPSHYSSVWSWSWN